MRPIGAAVSGVRVRERLMIAKHPDASGDHTWAMRIVRRLGEGPYARQTSLVLRRDLSVPFTPPRAKIPLRLREFDPGDMPALFPPGCDTSGERERRDVSWRRDRVERGHLASRCYVAVEDGTDHPCHIQWLTLPGCSEEVRRVGALPTLAIGEALLENAYTPLGYRGLGIMPEVIGLIAERASVGGTRRLLAVVDTANHSSLKAARRAGLIECSLRTREQYGFGVIRRVRFDRLITDGDSH